MSWINKWQTRWRSGNPTSHSNQRCNITIGKITIAGIYLVDSSADNPIHFTASNYGTLTANFQQSLSLEQYLAIILGPVSVVSIAVSWLFRNRQRRYLNKYLIAINSVYDKFLYKDGEDNNNRRQEYMHSLNGVRKEITQLYIKGKISDAHYNVLDKIVSDYMIKADNK
jgi:hypothetical protein